MSDQAEMTITAYKYMIPTLSAYADQHTAEHKHITWVVGDSVICIGCPIVAIFVDEGILRETHSHDPSINNLVKVEIKKELSDEN